MQTTLIGLKCSLARAQFNWGRADQEGRDWRKSLRSVSLGDEKIKYYDLDGYFLKDSSNGIAKVYYEDLIKREMMDPADTPFIIAWNVVSTSGDINMLPSGVDALSGVENFRVRSNPGSLDVICEGVMNIEIFNTMGFKAVRTQCVAGVNSFALPAGIYVVKNGKKTIKAIVK